MTLRRCLLVLLMLALPVQGALAASRLCLALMHAPAAAAPADHAHHPHRADAGHDPQDSHHGGGTDHAAGSCSLCAACCLTVAVAPDAPRIAATSAAYAGHPPFAVPVPHNVADGLERPPRTI